MRISDWSSDVCSSDLRMGNRQDRGRSIGIRKHRIRWYAAASFAALLCLLGLYIYGPFQKNEFSSSVVASVPQQQDVDPGGNRATLTLSNGDVIVLNEAGQGRLAEQDGVDLVKPDQGQRSEEPQSE